MTEDSEANLNHAGLWMSERRAVGLSKEGSFDLAAMQNAEGGKLAGFDAHLKPLDARLRPHRIFL